MTDDIEIKDFMSDKKLSSQLSRISKELEEKTKKLSASEKSLNEVKIEMNQLRRELAAERKIQSHQSQREYLLSANEETVSQLSKQNEKLEKENQMMRKYITEYSCRQDARSDRHKRELEEARVQIKEQSSSIDSMREKLLDSTNTTKHLRRLLEASYVKVSKAHKEKQKLAEEREEAEVYRREDERLVPLVSEIRQEVEELEALAQALCQMLKGEDPPMMTALLGIDPSLSPQTPSTKETKKDLFDQLEKIQGKLNHSKSAVREAISDHYADTLCQRSSCISQ